MAANRSQQTTTILALGSASPITLTRKWSFAEDSGSCSSPRPSRRQERQAHQVLRALPRKLSSTPASMDSTAHPWHLYPMSSQAAYRRRRPSIQPAAPVRPASRTLTSATRSANLTSIKRGIPTRCSGTSPCSISFLRRSRLRSPTLATVASS